MKDYLPVFCTGDDQIDILNKWRLGTQDDLTNYPIATSQAWAVVRLVFTSGKYTLDQKQAIFEDQKQKTPGILAELTNNTTMALSAEAG